jgi:ubiquinone/menaquinone biosynthesis C-methylase UbiE
MNFLILAAALAILGGFLYWLLILTEGAYLGPAVVRALYDRGAGSYDRVKDFDIEADAWNLAIPLESRLKGKRHPLVLDIATGTGRVLLAILRRPDFDGRVVGLDVSWRMVREAQRKCGGYWGRVDLVINEAPGLPLRNDSFDAVICIEALEFLPSPRHALREMARVLVPGGTLLVSNRVGRDAFFFPGRAFKVDKMKEQLISLGLEQVENKRWEDCYDLVWARKGLKKP